MRYIWWSLISSYNRRLKWAVLITNCPLSVVVFVGDVNFSHFLILSRTTGPIATKLGHRILRWSKFKFVQMTGPDLFHGEISKIVKILKRKLTWPIYTKLGTKHRWVNEIQLCSNERACVFPRGIIMKRQNYIDEI